MITTETEAYELALANAHMLDRIEIYYGNVARVVLEGEPASEGDFGQIAEIWEPKLPEKLEWINSVLVKKGWPDLSPWWRKEIARAYFAGRRSVVYRVGRRGGKSSSMCRVSVYETVFGDHAIPPGDVGVFGIVSAERPQAKDRIDTCAAICAAIGVEHKALAQTIEFKDLNRRIQAFTASKEGVVGGTSVGWILDEITRWRDSSDGSNPAIEVVRSLMPSMATMPNAKAWWISSPYSTLDIHYEAIERGNNKHQIVSIAPTWVANPTLSEEDTKALEPDEETWLREYAAVPSSGEEQKFFNAQIVEEAVLPKKFVPDRAAAGGDFAFRKDSSAVVTVESDGEFIKVTSDRAWKPGRLPLRPSVVFAEALSLAATNSCEAICCDLHYIESLREELEDSDIGLVEFPTDNEKISKVWVDIRVKLARGLIDLSLASKDLVAQLKEVSTKPLAGGGMSIVQKRNKNGHGDLASAFVCAVYNLGSTLAKTESPDDSSRRFARDPSENLEKMNEFSDSD
jgi:hypothetical protein